MKSSSTFPLHNLVRFSVLLERSAGQKTVAAAGLAVVVIELLSQRMLKT